ncbi:MAG: polyribonucleotide nucleotidyltransferase [Candidatus Omnitrophota bacterium]|jgi:polyribonucleotide nucleotidyltransferase
MPITKVAGEFANQEIIIETGHIAKQAHGAVTVRIGETVILATAVSEREPKANLDFFPLTVDYRERTYAAGKIPGGYFKREGRPTEKEILTSRLIDRPIRPLFPDSYRCETQVMVTVLSSDGENATDIPSVNGASAALLISDIPFLKPIGAVRVGLIEGALVANAKMADMGKSDLDLVAVATEEKMIMLEAGAREISEEKMIEAIEFAHREIRKVIGLQKELAAKVGKAKRAVAANPVTEEILQKIRSLVGDGFERVFTLDSKEEREDASKALFKKALAGFDATAPDFSEGTLKTAFDEIERENVRTFILDKGRRPDGRGEKDIRQITCEVGVLPRTHGSAIFTRGQTQSLCVTTLGTGEDEQIMDTLEGDITKCFMLHYNFPSFSVGEARPNRGPGRREIGHGALAERALEAVMPSSEEFPYTVRLVSDILESNGSSSMATVCGGTLALMDAGVPLKAPVAGIAIGLVTRGNQWKVITDIAGIEDHHGDMDFKAAGTSKGLTALQMDLKIDGITGDALREAFHQAKDARFKLLDKITATIASPRGSLSQYAPRITTLKINPAKIGELIGPGGKNIRKIVEETGAKIDIEDDGRVFVASTDAAASEAAIARIQAITAEAELGKIYQGTVQRLAAFGAFCEIMPDKDGLLHVSEIADGYVKDVTEYLRLGDTLEVKVIGIDDMGKIKLSAKQAQPGGLKPAYPSDPSLISETSKGRDRDRGRGGPRSRSRS